MFCKKSVRKNFGKSTGKQETIKKETLAWAFSCERLGILLEKKHWDIFFPVNFAKFLRTPLVAASA